MDASSLRTASPRRASATLPHHGRRVFSLASTPMAFSSIVISLGSHVQVTPSMSTGKDLSPVAMLSSDVIISRRRSDHPVRRCYTMQKPYTHTWKVAGRRARERPSTRPPEGERARRGLKGHVVHRLRVLCSAFHCLLAYLSWQIGPSSDITLHDISILYLYRLLQGLRPSLLCFSAARGDQCTTWKSAGVSLKRILPVRFSACTRPKKPAWPLLAMPWGICLRHRI